MRAIRRRSRQDGRPPGGRERALPRRGRAVGAQGVAVRRTQPLSRLVGYEGHWDTWIGRSPPGLYKLHRPPRLLLDRDRAPRPERIVGSARVVTDSRRDERILSG